MARSLSGRVVVEVDPELKLELYTALASEGSTLKAWFIEEAQSYINLHRQPLLFHRSAVRPRPQGSESGGKSK